MKVKEDISKIVGYSPTELPDDPAYQNVPEVVVLYRNQDKGIPFKEAWKNYFSTAEKIMSRYGTDNPEELAKASSNENMREFFLINATDNKEFAPLPELKTSLDPLSSDITIHNGIERNGRKRLFYYNSDDRKIRNNLPRGKRVVAEIGIPMKNLDDLEKLKNHPQLIGTIHKHDPQGGSMKPYISVYMDMDKTNSKAHKEFAKKEIENSSAIARAKEARYFHTGDPSHLGRLDSIKSPWRTVHPNRDKSRLEYTGNLLNAPKEQHSDGRTQTLRYFPAVMESSRKNAESKLKENQMKQEIAQGIESGSMTPEDISKYTDSQPNRNLADSREIRTLKRDLKNKETVTAEFVKTKDTLEKLEQIKNSNPDVYAAAEPDVRKRFEKLSKEQKSLEDGIKSELTLLKSADTDPSMVDKALEPHLKAREAEWKQGWAVFRLDSKEWDIPKISDKF